MNRTNFLEQKEVEKFVNWAAAKLSHIPVTFNIRSSSKVPGGVVGSAVGLDEVIARYRWRSGGEGRGTWEETVETLSVLRTALNEATNDHDVLLACCAILKWGGDRNSRNGAWPFLSAMVSEENDLMNYIARSRDAFLLDHAILGEPLPIRKMNAMLTKVHALASPDGLPIYDSRVAAAIASLVELWRREAGEYEALPACLAFPATDDKRQVSRLFRDAIAPRVIRHGSGDADRNTKDWAEAKIRLAWLMHAVLEKNKTLLARQGPSRMHAFEASLFMIGYDVTCLADAATGRSATR